jgi:hypothetical protein
MAYQDIELIINTGQSFVTGQFVQVIHDLNNYMFGQVVSYNSETGDFVFTPTSVAGSGTYTSWYVVPSGSVGQASLFEGTTTDTIIVPATTTTTTTINYPTNFYYILRKYTCPGCSVVEDLQGRSSTFRVTGYYYNIGDGFVYLIQGSTSSTLYDVNLDGAATQGTDCSGTCAI